MARGTAFLEEPTIADIYDQAMGNEPVVGILASISAHVPMMGHGSQWPEATRTSPSPGSRTGRSPAGTRRLLSGSSPTRWLRGTASRAT